MLEAWKQAFRQADEGTRGECDLSKYSLVVELDDRGPEPEVVLCFQVNKCLREIFLREVAGRKTFMEVNGLAPILRRFAFKDAP